MVTVDLSILTKELEALGVNVDKLEPAFEKAKKAAEGLGSVSLNKLSGSMDSYIKQLNDLTGATSQKLRQSNLDNSKSFELISNSITKLLTLTTKFNAFDDLDKKSGRAVESMQSQFDGLIGRFGGWEKAASKLMGAGLSSVATMGEDGARKFLEVASSAQRLEGAYMNLQSETGNFNKLFDEQNKLLPELDAEVGRYASTLTQTALITGESTKTVADYTAKLGTIPNVVGKLIDVGLGYGQQLEGTLATMTLARGAGRDIEEVYKAMSVAQEKLSGSQGRVTDNLKRGADMFALMNEALKIGGLRFQDTEDYLIKVADKFSLIGDNTQAATNMLTRFSGALQNTGLTGKQSVEVISHMVDSIKNLDVGTKAMISARSGGPGGLQGSFRIDQLMRQGKMDEVSGMLERSLRQQFGGRIYTQEDAANSPQAASQFMRQRSLLQSGAFGGLAKDPESATRLLEALKAGPAATKEAIKSASEATKDVAEKGQELQQKQVSILNQINAAMDRSVALQQISILKLARETFGTGNAEVNEAYEASIKASAEDILQAYKNGPKSLGAQQNRANELSAADIMDSGPAALKGIKTGFDSFAGNVSDAFKETYKLTQEHAKNSRFEKAVENDVAKTSRATARDPKYSIQTATAHAMRQAPTTLASQVPTAVAVNKHEVSIKPLEVNITVTRDPDTSVNTTTNSSNATVKDVVNQASNGFLNKNR